MGLSDTLGRLRESSAAFVVVGVVIGLVAAPVLAGLAPALFGAVGTDRPDGVVAVVPVQGMIEGETATRVQGALARARASEDIDAVVLVANSGGGAPAASEEIYLSVKRVRESGIPVTAAVDGVAASGAYYAIAPAQEIYVKPGSTVGSIGVLAQLPTQVEPNDIVGATGPNKVSGADRREFRAVLESLQAAFVGAVRAQRGDRLRLSRTELEQGRVYAGAQSVRNGLADEIGDREAAIQAAARRAGLEDYRVRVLDTTSGTTEFVSRTAYLASDVDDGRMVDVSGLLTAGGGPSFLMVGSVYLTDTGRTVAAEPGGTGGDGAANESAEETEAEDEGTSPAVDPALAGENGGGAPAGTGTSAASVAGGVDRGRAAPGGEP